MKELGVIGGRQGLWGRQDIIGERQEWWDGGRVMEGRLG